MFKGDSTNINIRFSPAAYKLSERTCGSDVTDRAKLAANTFDQVNQEIRSILEKLSQESLAAKIRYQEVSPNALEKFSSKLFYSKPNISINISGVFDHDYIRSMFTLKNGDCQDVTDFQGDISLKINSITAPSAAKKKLQEDSNDELENGGVKFKFNFLSNLNQNPLEKTYKSGEEAVIAITNYIDDLIQYGCIRPDLTVADLDTASTQKLKLRNTAELLQIAAKTVDTDLAKRLRILDDFCNKKLSLGQIAEKYPGYSTRKTAKLIAQYLDKKNDAAVELTSLVDTDLKTYNWNAPINILVDLNERDLQLFNEAVLELKKQFPNEFTNVQFIIVSPKLRGTKTNNNLTLDATAYFDSFREACMQRDNTGSKRCNLIFIGRDEQAAEVPLKVFDDLHGRALGFFGMAIFGENSNKDTLEIRGRGVDNLADIVHKQYLLSKQDRVISTEEANMQREDFLIPLLEKRIEYLDLGGNLENATIKDVHLLRIKALILDLVRDKELKQNFINFNQSCLTSAERESFKKLTNNKLAQAFLDCNNMIEFMQRSEISTTNFSSNQPYLTLLRGFSRRLKSLPQVQTIENFLTELENEIKLLQKKTPRNLAKNPVIRALSEEVTSGRSKPEAGNNGNGHVVNFNDASQRSDYFLRSKQDVFRNTFNKLATEKPVTKKDFLKAITEAIPGLATKRTKQQILAFAETMVNLHFPQTNENELKVS